METPTDNGDNSLIDIILFMPHNKLYHQIPQV